MINEINANGDKITGDKNIANEFNKYFSEIGKKLGREIPWSDMDPLYFVNPVSNSFIFKSISKEDLYHAIFSMKANRSAGIDKISVRLLQVLEPPSWSPYTIYSIYRLKLVYFQKTGKQLELRQFINPMIKQNVVIIDPFRLYQM